MCDNLLSSIIRYSHPICLLCGGATEVAHHFCHKSKSLVLRYDMENLIPLCNKCHCRLHHNESYEGGLIVGKKGVVWLAYIEKKKQESTKLDYNEVYERLIKMPNDRPIEY